MIDMSLDGCWADTVLFNDRYFPNWRKNSPINMTNAMAGEAGEVMELFSEILLTKYTGKIGVLCNSMKKICGGGTNMKKVPTLDEFLEELVDIDIYKILLLGTLGVDSKAYIQVFTNKIDKIYKRMSEKE